MLMEADFNFLNKMIYRVQMMNNAYKYGSILEEIYSKKGKTAGNRTLANILSYDIVR